VCLLGAKQAAKSMKTIPNKIVIKTKEAIVGNNALWNLTRAIFNGKKLLQTNHSKL
jgi:hypothetical protein